MTTSIAENGYVFVLWPDGPRMVHPQRIIYLARDVWSDNNDCPGHGWDDLVDEDDVVSFCDGSCRGPREDPITDIHDAIAYLEVQGAVTFGDLERKSRNEYPGLSQNVS